MFLSRASAITVLTLSIGSAVTLATPKPWLPQGIAQNLNNTDRPARGMPRWIQQLNLTSEQTQRMQAISSKYRNQMDQPAQSLRQAQTELSQLIAGDATSDVLRQKHRQIESLRQQVGNFKFESLLEMREVLTPDQRRQLAQNMQNKRRNRNTSNNALEQQQ